MTTWTAFNLFSSRYKFKVIIQKEGCDGRGINKKGRIENGLIFPGNLEEVCWEKLAQTGVS